MDSLLMASGFWAGVEEAANLPTGYGRTGRLQPVADAAAADRLADRIAAAAQRWPEDCAMRLTDAPVGALVPDSPSGLWLFDGLTARLAPRAAGAALAQAIRNRGGEIVEGQAPGDPAGPVLWTTGTEGLADLSRDLGQPIGKGVKGQSALLRYAAPDAPQIFAEALHIVPHADGTVAVGSTSENVYDHLDPDDQIDGLIAKARAICPQLRDAPVIDRWAGARPARAAAPDPGVLARPPGPLRRQRRLQDRLRHGAQDRAGNGRPDPGRPGRNPRRIPPDLIHFGPNILGASERPEKGPVDLLQQERVWQAGVQAKRPGYRLPSGRQRRHADQQRMQMQQRRPDQHRQQDPPPCDPEHLWQP
ncbi:FAD-dependent oxidoreductase [Paracoccus aerius]